MSFYFILFNALTLCLTVTSAKGKREKCSFSEKQGWILFWKVPRKGNLDLSRCFGAATNSTLASELEGNVLPPVHLVSGNISADLPYFFISEKAFNKNIAFPFPVA